MTDTADDKLVKLPHPISRVEVDVALKRPLRLSDSAFPPMKVGSYVSLRLADGGGDTKTYLGIYMGDLPIGIALGIRTGDEDVLVVKSAMTNPAIYVPDLRQLHYGLESWWGAIKSPEELREITNADINNVWYVQAMRELFPDAPLTLH